MADFSGYKPIVDQLDYPQKYNFFVDGVEVYANELEAAREGEISVVANLNNNYLKYTLNNNIDGSYVTGTAVAPASNTFLTTATNLFLNKNLSGATIYNKTTNTYAKVVGYGADFLNTTDIGSNWTGADFEVGFSCNNMLNAGDKAEDLQSYITKGEALTLSGTLNTDIASIVASSLKPGDMIVVDVNGDNLTGREVSYTRITGLGNVAEYNKSYYTDVSSGNVSVTLPSGIDGGVIAFADLGGHIGPGSSTVTIIPATGESIMGEPNDDTLVINDFPYISFKLVYVTGTGLNTWMITELQR
jgi:hypothetical protein